MTTATRRFAAAVAMAVAVTAGGRAQQPAQDRPATARLTAYLKAFNSSDPAEVRRFIEDNFAESALRETSADARVARYASARTRLKSMTLRKIVAERENRTFALVAAGNQEVILLRADVEPAPPHKLLAIMLEMVEDPDSVAVPDPKQDDAALAGAVRAEMEVRSKADEFSGVVLVAKGPTVIFHEAYGLANRATKTPNRRDTMFNLGSINKSFTQVAIHQLEKAGKLSLTDTIGKFLPDYPNRQAAEQVTIRHLLTMTSGIGDFFGPRYQATPKERIRSLKDYLPLFADLPLEFAPGTGNRYSNGGYVVLGAIIEKASGEDYYSYVREHVFKPAGMLATDSYPRDAATPNLALGYTGQGRSGRERVLNVDTLPGRGSSAGGGYSTAEDMLRYVRALASGTLVLPDLRGGLGIAGGAPGINAAVEWDARTGYVVIVMANRDPPAAMQVAQLVRSWLPE
jgi:CubicO group peptidase (beta-lactamase class C family)